jgi:uncharacterized RDD family membrane protein YckC
MRDVVVMIVDKVHAVVGRSTRALGGGEQMYCSRCGFELSENAKFCSKCGSKASTEEAAPIMRPPTVSNEVESSGAVSQVRPWVRYFARTLDILLVHFLFWIACLIIGVRIQLSTGLLIGMIPPVIWLFIEPVFLMKWGATPGKVLLRTRVVHRNGALLSYDEALKRSISVWIRGEAFYIPVVLLVANIVAYNRLTKRGVTSWDEAGSVLVQHGQIGAARVIVLIVLIVLFVAVYSIVEMIRA